MPDVFRGAANETSVTEADITWQRLGGEEVAEVAVDHLTQTRVGCWKDFSF